MIKYFFDKKVIYHDPCELSRIIGVKRPPRSLLEKVGVEILEVEPSCSGGGGLLRASNAELSKDIAHQKIKSQGLDKFPVITSCPSCIEQFKANGVEAHDLFEFMIQIIEGDNNAT